MITEKRAYRPLIVEPVNMTRPRLTNRTNITPSAGSVKNKEAEEPGIRTPSAFRRTQRLSSASGHSTDSLSDDGVSAEGDNNEGMTKTQ